MNRPRRIDLRTGPGTLAEREIRVWLAWRRRERERLELARRPGRGGAARSRR